MTNQFLKGYSIKLFKHKVLNMASTRSLPDTGVPDQRHLATKMKTI